MATLPAIKRGDTFVLGCSYSGEDGTLENLDEVTIRSQVRTKTSRTLVSELLVEKSDQITNPSEFTLSSATSTWPIGNMILDIKFVVGGVVTSTDTLEFTVNYDVTHD